MKISRSILSSISVGAILALSIVGPAAAAVQPPLPGTSVVQVAQVKAPVGYWHGYHGSRTERPGTRRHSDGYWYPDAAFGVDPGTTGSITSNPVRPMQRQTYCQSTFGGTNGDGSMPCNNGF
ncbi:surface protein [Rhizobium sp. 18055]|uniref:surface protein n=1 Tax=Rhizobium sp. 18055 TaxID=2681403 RepID=UPI00135C8F94|nr:surface protein [Rhizobium sp. 18055]